MIHNKPKTVKTRSTIMVYMSKFIDMNMDFIDMISEKVETYDEFRILMEQAVLKAVAEYGG